MLTSFANGTVFGTRNGDNPQVLALHGWGGTSAQLAPAVAGLSSIALDLPGFGASPVPDEVWGAEQYAKVISAVLDEFSSPPVVLGYSFGGRIAVCLASAWPDRVGSLVLTGVPLLRLPSAPRRTSFAYRAMKKAHQLGLVSDERIEAEKRKRGSADYRNATGVMRDILVRAVNETYEPQIVSTKCPVEMVWGEDDTAATLEMACRAQEMFPAANLTVVPGRGHFLPAEEPNKITAAIERCLS